MHLDPGDPDCLIHGDRSRIRSCATQTFQISDFGGSSTPEQEVVLCQPWVCLCQTGRAFAFIRVYQNISARGSRCLEHFSMNQPAQANAEEKDRPAQCGSSRPGLIGYAIDNGVIPTRTLNSFVPLQIDGHVKRNGVHRALVKPRCGPRDSLSTRRNRRVAAQFNMLLAMTRSVSCTDA
ncbi:MAG: hypothetical protein F4213_02260 [Boseongicola sp. SB0677_bin_26]|nr:hypothetical protein [Boseongicola sp. SB0665_bin_10]MYG24840.1 hypothetical protein [Boseongicola sp. SB0677_bin_26]